jgi:hypothetical protein
MNARRFSPLFGLLLLVSSLALTTNSVSAAQDPAVMQAVDWLHSQQKPDGGYAGLNGSTDPGTTADVALAIAAAGTDPNTVSNGGASMIDFLKVQAGAYGNSVGGAAKLVLAAVAAGDDPRDFGGQNLVQTILSHFDPSTGLFDSQLYVHAYAVLALTAANQSVPMAAVNALEQHQATDGGWAFTGATDAGQADSNTTAVAIEALIATGHASSPTLPKAMDYLSKLEADDGLFAYQPTPGSSLVGDANSTALVVQAMLATGQAHDSAPVSKALTALDTLRNGDSGAFAYRKDTPGDNLLATVQAIPSLEGKPLPVWPVHAPGRTLDQAKSQATPGDSTLCIYVDQTKHNVCNGFLAYWQHFGGVESFGYPLTEEFTFVDQKTGRPTTMQYFERARFEWHPGSSPERFDVQLGLLGEEMLNNP